MLGKLVCVLSLLLINWHAGAGESIGSPANGCLTNATELPLDASGYQVLRPERNRYYGHNTLIHLIQKLGETAHQAHWGQLLIGDLSVATGGPLLDGHRSHQNGLDADILFAMPAEPLPAFALATPEMPEMVMPDGKHIDHEMWRAGQEQLLKLIAEDPQVDRVFVHAAIKKHLCQKTSSDAWLRKIRPWWGHTEHLHVRMLCPKDSPDCVDTNPIPNGDGCDVDLDWWFQQPPPETEELHDPVPPVRCRMEKS